MLFLKCITYRWTKYVEKKEEFGDISRYYLLDLILEYTVFMTCSGFYMPRVTYGVSLQPSNVQDLILIQHLDGSTPILPLARVLLTGVGPTKCCKNQILSLLPPFRHLNKSLAGIANWLIIFYWRLVSKYDISAHQYVTSEKGNRSWCFNFIKTILV